MKIGVSRERHQASCMVNNGVMADVMVLSCVLAETMLIAS